ncbi:unnamed protein product [Gordionus sp. m RMFG-2023]
MQEGKIIDARNPDIAPIYKKEDNGSLVKSDIHKLHDKALNGLLRLSYDNVNNNVIEKDEEDRVKEKYSHREKVVKDYSIYDSKIGFSKQYYISIIKKQEKDLKLLQNILQRILDSNGFHFRYRNIDGIKIDSYWDDNSQSWILPDLFFNKLVLKSEIDNKEIDRFTQIREDSQEGVNILEASQNIVFQSSLNHEPYILKNNIEIKKNLKLKNSSK